MRDLPLGEADRAQPCALASHRQGFEDAQRPRPLIGLGIKAGEVEHDVVIPGIDLPDQPQDLDRLGVIEA